MRGTELVNFAYEQNQIKMKKIAFLNLFLILSIVLASCSTSNNVVNNRTISKRKYNKGFHFNKKSSLKSSKDELASDDFKAEPSNTPRVERENAIVTRTTRSTSSDVYSNDVENNDIIEGAELQDDLSQDDVTSHSSNRRSEDVEPQDAAETWASTSASTRDSKSTTQEKENNQSSGWSDAMFVLAVIFAILLPPLGVAIYTNIDWTKVLIALLLMIILFLPGMIYALLVVFDVI